MCDDAQRTGNDRDEPKGASVWERLVAAASAILADMHADKLTPDEAHAKWQRERAAIKEGAPTWEM